MKQPNYYLLILFSFLQLTQAFAQSETWYIRRDPPEPWTWCPILNTNMLEMDEAFGAGGWESGFYASVDATEVFDSNTCMVFLEGGDDHALEFNDFVTANLSLMEEWVFNGGNLYMNAGPNYGGSINCGFDGVTIVYPSFAGNAEAVDPTHPIFNGPYLPVGTTWTGPWFAHAEITGPDLIPLLTDPTLSTYSLAEKNWGGGKVIFGGMTVSGWHEPYLESSNMHINILKYLASYAFLDFSYPDSSYCSNEPEIIFPTFAPGAAVGFLVAQPDGLVIDSITGAIDIGLSLPGTYTIYNSIEDDGCKSDSAEFTLTIHVPIPVEAGQDVSLCRGSTTSISASGAESYEWIPTTYLSDPTASITDVENPLTDMDYLVVGTDINGCKDTDDVSVTLFPDPIIDAGPDVDIPLGGYTVLNVTGGSGYLWNEDPTLSAYDIFNPTASPQDTTTYYVTGTDANGCLGFDTITVNVIIEPGIHTPNAFSPNGDGFNDVFQPILLACTLNDFSIYNRWGEQIFVSTNINNGWNGQVNGKEAELGAYVVIVNATAINGAPLRANTNVILVK
jgi:gliding motility-associated-like protein